MADEQKPVETPKEAPATETVPAEVKPTEETKTEDKPAEAAAVAEAAPAEAPKEEAKPVEEGTLEHKSAESKLPKNFLYSKEAFWFGSDAVETDKLAGYVKAAKNVDVAHQNAAWAASTGKGLLFVGSKDTPTGIINLGEASDVTTDGPVKFHFSASGFKHTFKASTKADAENWVSQLKLKITEAKASKEAVVATEAYTQAMEGFKPTPAKKEEPSAEPATEEAKTEEAVPEAPVVEEAKEEVKTEEPAKDEVKTEEEAAKETKEEPKRRSASRKRESVNIMSFFKKEKKESKAEEKPAETVAATETPAEASTDAPAATEEPVVEPVASTEEAKVEEEPKEKPSIQKRARYVLLHAPCVMSTRSNSLATAFLLVSLARRRRRLLRSLLRGKRQKLRPLRPRLRLPPLFLPLRPPLPSMRAFLPVPFPLRQRR